MPPYLDIYVLTKLRNVSSIQQFLDAYVDQAASEDRGDEELMLVPIATNRTQLEAEACIDWNWEAVGTLSHAITRGLDYPRRAFSIYLKSKIKRIERAILTFTTDNLIVFGLSIDGTQSSQESERRARRLLGQMEARFDAYLGMISVDQSPPLHEDAFYQRKDNPLTVYFWQEQPHGDS